MEMWWSVTIEVVGRNEWRYPKMLMVEQSVGSVWLSVSGGKRKTLRSGKMGAERTHLQELKVSMV